MGAPKRRIRHFHVPQQRRPRALVPGQPDLLERAGVAASAVFHVHGTIGKDRCNASCGYEETIDLAHPPPLRACPRCGAYLRPAVVWFGETLPQRVWSEPQRICAELDCLIVVGTSATVAPAASLIDVAAEAGSKIISINTEPSALFGAEHIELLGTASALLPPLLEGLTPTSPH